MNDLVTVCSRRSSYTWKGRLYTSESCIFDGKGGRWNFVQMPQEVADALFARGLLVHPDPEELVQSVIEIVEDNN